MKHFLKSLTLILVFFSFSSTVYASEGVQKVGIVFPSEVMKESAQREHIIKKLEAEFKGRYTELKGLEKELQKLDKSLKRDSELMSSPQLLKEKREMEVKLSEYKLKRKAFEEDNRRRQGEEQQKVLTVMRDVINKIAKDGHYDLILNGDQIIYAKPSYDISKQVIKKISEK